MTTACMNHEQKILRRIDFGGERKLGILKESYGSQKSFIDETIQKILQRTSFRHSIIPLIPMVQSQVLKSSTAIKEIETELKDSSQKKLEAEYTLEFMSPVEFSEDTQGSNEKVGIAKRRKPKTEQSLQKNNDSPTNGTQEIIQDFNEESEAKKFANSSSELPIQKSQISKKAKRRRNQKKKRSETSQSQIPENNISPIALENPINPQNKAENDKNSACKPIKKIDSSLEKVLKSDRCCAYALYIVLAVLVALALSTTIGYYSDPFNH